MNVPVPPLFAGCPKIDIVGANAFAEQTHVRAGCRGLVLRGREMLISHELNSGWYLIPGGGLEEGESLEDCCVREIREETGITVSIEKPLLVLHEIYEDWLYISYYFLCSPSGEGLQALTAQEASRGLVKEWMDIGDALAIFARHQDYAEESEPKRGSYQREYTALSHFLKSEANRG